MSTICIYPLKRFNCTINLYILILYNNCTYIYKNSKIYIANLMRLENGRRNRKKT